MARIRRRRDKSRSGTWRQSLLFNSLLVLLVVLGARVMTNAYTAESVGDVPDIQARNETRREIDGAFQTIVPKGNVARAFWADQIARELESRDFSAARGYLLAAPVMLDRDDARAILAAADAEESGSQDLRLTKAALLFLPNEVRASYQRAIEPPRIELSEDDSDAVPAEVPPVPDTAETAQASPDEATEGGAEAADEADSDSETGEDDLDPLAGNQAFRSASFSMVGDKTDLVRRSQRWINGDAVDSMQLRLSALSLIEHETEAQAELFLRAASVLKAAGRARRLTPAYRTYLRERIDLAMPEDQAFAAIKDALSGVAPMSELEARVLAAFQGTVNKAGLERLERDLRGIARVSELTSPAGAVTLLETASSPEDIRKLQLIAEAGGDRAVALTKQIGPRVLSLAQIGVKWSTQLALQLMAMVGIAMALAWTALSAVSNARPVNHYRR